MPRRINRRRVFAAGLLATASLLTTAPTAQAILCHECHIVPTGTYILFCW